MRLLSSASAVFFAIILPHLAFGQDPATNPGRAIVTLGIEVVEIAGECDSSGFGIYKKEAAYVTFFSINLIREDDGGITGIFASRISLGDEDWDIFRNGPIVQDEFGYSFEAKISDGSLILGERFPAHVEVTCLRPFDQLKERITDGPEWPETPN